MLMAMNLALWKKAVFDAWRQLLLSGAALLLFGWVFVWLMSLFPMSAWLVFLRFVPDFIQSMVGVPFAKLATPLGQMSILYVHVVTLLVCVGWALGRGSDSISGEIARGTMDLVLSLPVWRPTVMIVPAVVSTVGAALLVASVWLGTILGLACFHLQSPVSPRDLLPGALNLFCMVFCFTGITTFVSSWNRDRWRTMSWAGGFFILSLIVEMVGRMWAGGGWLRWFSFLTLFRPQELILLPDQNGWAGVECNLALVLLGLLSFAAAGLVLWRRDIPSPL
jgi:ABC-2 type transport system permease protein